MCNAPLRRGVGRRRRPKYLHLCYSEALVALGHTCTPMLNSQIIAYIFDAREPDLAAQFAAWVAESPRFKTFAEIYRDKIRKKTRGLRDAEGSEDLRFELAVAYLLLRERRFAVEYEKYGVGKQRAPDFTVTFKTNLPLNVEVKRMRLASQDLRGDGSYALSKTPNTVCEKIGQLPPSAINLLALTATGAFCTAGDVAPAMKLLKERADRGDDLFFAQRGFEDARDFLRQYTRLSGILFYERWDPAAADPPLLWLNAQARHPPPADLAAALRK